MAKRTRRRRVDALIQNADTPVFAIDAKRQVMLFNQGCEKFTGWPAEEVLGRLCEYNSGSEADAVTTLCGALCPPPAVFEGRSAHVPAHIVTRVGHSLARVLHFHPIQDEDGGVIFVFGTIDKPDSIPATHRVSTSQRLHAELAAVRAAVRERYGSENFIGRGSAMQRVFEQFAVARECDAALLLSGEAGTGKEHLARAIHADGPKRVNAFVPVDCAALPPREVRRTLRRVFDTLIESDSTSPPATIPGTLFLQHIDRLHRDSQELLLEQFAIESDDRLGLRIIASTTATLSAGDADEPIDAELLHRLTTISIALPALRNRSDDFEPLAQAFLEQWNAGGETQIEGFADDVWTQLRDYRWPGNLDELHAVIREARAACGGSRIEIADLPFRFRTGLDAQTVGPPIRPSSEPLDDYLSCIEIERIQDALRQSKQNKSQAAKLLGMTRPRLYRRMQALGIADLEEA